MRRHLLAAAAVLAMTLHTGTASAQETIKLGINQPLTGVVAASGNFVTNGAKIAADEQRDVINLLLNDFEENAADWLWGVDRDFNLEHASVRFYDQLQVPDSMVLGRPITTIMPFSFIFFS